MDLQVSKFSSKIKVTERNIKKKLTNLCQKMRQNVRPSYVAILIIGFYYVTILTQIGIF